MKRTFLLLIIATLFCTWGTTQNNLGKVVGEWKTYDIKIGHIHGLFDVEKPQKAELVNRFPIEYSLELKTNNQFTLIGELGEEYSGNYSLSDTTLLLLKNNGQLLVQYRVDSINSNYMYLQSGLMLCYTTFKSDSLTYMTSESANWVLKKQ